MKAGLEGLAFRALLTMQAAGLTSAASNLRRLAESESASLRQESLLVSLANAHERLADQLLETLARETASGTAEPAFIPSDELPW